MTISMPAARGGVEGGLVAGANEAGAGEEGAVEIEGDYANGRLVFEGKKPRAYSLTQRRMSYPEVAQDCLSLAEN